MRYMILVDVHFRDPVPQAEGNGAVRDIAGYFMSIGVEGSSAEEAARRAETAAVAPDAETGWQPPTQYELREMEITPTDEHADAVVDPGGVFFKTGRAFYPAKQWWEFWK